MTDLTPTDGNWLPKYISKVFEYRTGQTLSAQELNAVLNLIVAQGDYNSSWLNFLTTDGIPALLENLTQETVTSIVTEIVDAYMNAATAQISNKTSANLNSPTVVLLDSSYTSSCIASFRDTVVSNAVKACICPRMSLVGTTSAFPTIQQLKAALAAGCEIVCGGYSADLSASNYTQLSTAMQIMSQNGLSLGGAPTVPYYYTGNIYTHNSFTLLVPGDYGKLAISDGTIYNYIQNVFYGSVNEYAAQGAVNPDTGVPCGYNLSVVDITSTDIVTDTELKTTVDDAIAGNKVIIAMVDSSAEFYSVDNLQHFIDYVKAVPSVKFAHLMEAIYDIRNSINNRIKQSQSDITALRSANTQLSAQLTDVANTVTTLKGQSLYVESFNANTGELRTTSTPT